MDRDLLRRLGKTYSKVKLIPGTGTTLLVPSVSLLTNYILSSRSQLWSALTYSPRVAQDAPTEILQTHVLSSKFGKFTDINGKPVNGFVSSLVREEIC
jgi:hypothetical protein